MGKLNLSDAVDRLGEAFDGLLLETSHGGAALSLFQHGEQLLSLFGGEASPGIPWERDTSCLIWSASKGVTAAVTLHALQETGIKLETRVAAIWPDFAQHGKEEITLAELLSHRAGLAAIEQRGLSINDHEAVTAALAAQSPNWNIHDAAQAKHAYGARTFGFLLDEIVRRVSDITLAEYWNRVFREPLGLDLWFGIPEGKLSSIATTIAPKTLPPPGEFSRAFGDSSSLTRRALSEPGGSITPTMMNTPAMRSASIPSLGVIATADSLARFYSILAAPNPYFTTATREQMSTTLARGLDLTLLAETSFSAGFMTNDFGVFGSGKFSFGHPGAGGSLGFADPELGLGFAFIPSAMHPGALPGPRTQKLVQTLYGIEGSA